MPSLVEIDQVVLKKKIFISFLYNFNIFAIISPWKRLWPFIWTNLNPIHPRMLCAKFGWNWPSGSWEEDENVNSLRQRQRRRTTDRFWSEKLTWAFGSGELKKEWDQTGVLLREIKNFKRSEFEPSRVTCASILAKKTNLFSNKSSLIYHIHVHSLV